MRLNLSLSGLIPGQRLVDATRTQLLAYLLKRAVESMSIYSANRLADQVVSQLRKSAVQSLLLTTKQPQGCKFQMHVL